MTPKDPKDLEHPRGRDDQAAPSGTGQLRGDAPRSQTRLAQGEGHDALLKERGSWVGIRGGRRSRGRRISRP